MHEERSLSATFSSSQSAQSVSSSWRKRVLPSSSRYLPAPHNAQEVERFCAVYRPSGQVTQDGELGWSLYSPGRHGKQRSSSLSILTYVPGRHARVGSAVGLGVGESVGLGVVGEEVGSGEGPGKHKGRVSRIFVS